MSLLGTLLTFVVVAVGIVLGYYLSFTTLVILILLSTIFFRSIMENNIFGMNCELMMAEASITEMVTIFTVSVCGTKLVGFFL